MGGSRYFAKYTKTVRAPVTFVNLWGIASREGDPELPGVQGGRGPD